MLPTGTVTFLFSDIEGSTRLLQALGPRYASLLDDHARIVRAAAAASEGTEVSTEGDSFFLVFGSPVAAVRAAAEIQRGLHGHPWPDDARVRVRMGLHTGEGILGGDNYIGIDVNRAARIAAAANGGQVLVSEETAGLVRRALPAGVSLRDLGVHRLKDLEHPEHLYQATVEGLTQEFPPPRTLDARPNNLPVQLTSFVGRDEVIADVERLLEGSRLLTLSGPGGTGKTRLSLEVATRALPSFRDGVFFVELSSITDPALVPSTIARMIGVPEEPGSRILETLKEHLRERQILLILDNFEQVVEAAPALEELLSAAERLKVIVTTRIVLQVRGEQEYPVPPLVLPDPSHLPDLATLSQYEAVRLFIDRAMAVKPGFEINRQNAPAVAEITARLDGLPLAIELAASRAKLLSPQQMLPRLEKSLSLLTGGGRTAPERQRTLRGAIAWSYDLLDETGRALFSRLSVFMGGCTFEAAEEVCDTPGLGIDAFDGLASLVDESLLRQVETPEGESRFVMLETIREFAAEKLEERGEADDATRRHREFFFALAREAEPHITGVDQKEWLDRLDREHDNIRAAFRWAIESGEAEAAQDVAGRLWRFWQQRGLLAEGRLQLERVLLAPGGDAVTPARVRGLNGAGSIAYWQNDYEAMARYYREAVAAARAVADRALLAESLYNSSYIPMVAGQLEEIEPILGEALEVAREAGARYLEATIEAALGFRHFFEGKPAAAIPNVESAVALYRELGNRWEVADNQSGLAGLYYRVGRIDEARAAMRESMEIFREVGNQTGVSMNLHALAYIAAEQGDAERAARLLGAGDRLREEAGGGAPPELMAMFGDPAAAARESLDDETFQRAWHEGYAMDLDKACAMAIEVLEALEPRSRSPGS